MADDLDQGAPSDRRHFRRRSAAVRRADHATAAADRALRDVTGERVAAEKHVQKWLDEDDAVDMLLSLIDGGWRPPDEIAALLAQARADGEEAGRGDRAHWEQKWRADQGERVARRIEAVAAREAGKHLIEPGDAYYDAAHIARSTSDSAR